MKSNTIQSLLMMMLISITTTTLSAQNKTVSLRVDSVMKALNQREQFTGSILVATQGKQLYRNALGKINGQPNLTPEIVMNIGSLAKGFTAMIVMMLQEANKLQYDDPITKYIPELSNLQKGITIRHLLTHTSGIPDVGDLGIDDPSLSNERAVNALSKQRFRFRDPGIKYQYSNTGYLLLATITEKVSGKKFVELLHEKILQPLAMKNTSISGKAVGMGDMFSTVDDLFIWEESFYTEKLVKRATLDSAFTPYPTKEGSSTYGFGWNIGVNENGRMIWHTGNSGAYKAFIGRIPSEKIAVIILTAGDSKRMEIFQAIVNITHDKPYALPKMSIVNRLYDYVNKNGIDKGIGLYHSLKQTDSKNYDFGEGELNSLGYKFGAEKRFAEAIRIFELNTISYPQSSNAFDSLAEGYLMNGDKTNAIRYYKQAIALDSTNLNSINMLKKLQP